MTTFIMAAYYLGGTTIKSAKLNIWSVKAVATPMMASASTAHSTAAGSFDVHSTTMDNSTPNMMPATVDTSTLGQDAAMGDSWW